MATSLNTLYPPVISTFKSAFIYKEEDVNIYFTLSAYNSRSDIVRAHVSLVNQKNNENALFDQTGILFKDINYDAELGMYYVTLHPNEVVNGTEQANAGQGNGFNINQLYKLQIRFDNNSSVDVSSFTTSQQKMQYLISSQRSFSEWSSVQLLRPIYCPKIRIKQLDSFLDRNPDGVQAFTKGLVRLAGGLYFGPESDITSIDDVETETLQAFQVSLLSGTEKDSDGNYVVIKEYPMQYTGNNLDPNDINYNIDLQTISVSENDTLILKIYCVTKNQYELTKTYQISIQPFESMDDFQPTITETVNNENGKVRIQITNAKNLLPGTTIIVKRESSIDKFKEAENIYSEQTNGPVNIDITDNTVASLVWYRYSVQCLTLSGQPTKLFYSRTIMPTFQDAILSRGKRQYDIRYNFSISNYKPVVNRAKIDTLGSKYPRFAENAVLGYKQFSISGIISAEADVYQDFITKANVTENGVMTEGVYSTDLLNNYYGIYKDYPSRSIIPSTEKGDVADSETDTDKIVDVVRNDFYNYYKYNSNQLSYYNDTLLDSKEGKFSDYMTDADLNMTTTQKFLTTTYNDWMWEREFREELIDWLNDGEPKLFRSQQEGNMVVMLTDVSLTPTSSRRFTYNFSATMYECDVATSLDVLDSLGIYDVVTVEESNASKGDEPTDHHEVMRIGQMYEYTVPTFPESETRSIITLIQDDLTREYGIATKDADTGEETKNVNSALKAMNIRLRNVKIYFQSNPHLYRIDGSSYVEIRDAATAGTPNQYNLNDVSTVDTLQASELDTRSAFGYVFTMQDKNQVSDSNSTGYKDIFVNARGYYEIPENLDITYLSFPHVGDIVTVEYTLMYDEYPSSAEIVTGTQVVSRIVGQEYGVYQPDTRYGNKIRNKYGFETDTFRQSMDYWNGICLDVTPFALCQIRYEQTDSDWQTLEVGETGVLHLLSDDNDANLHTYDIRFLGRRMTINQDEEHENSLRDWECYLDESVTNSPSSATKMNWFYMPRTDSYNKVTIYDSTGTDDIDPLFRRIGTMAVGENGTSPYVSTKEIANPKYNHVYMLDSGNMKIYYIDGRWYDFELLDRDNSSSWPTPNSQNPNEIGLAKVPIEGCINYCGSVLQRTITNTVVNTGD